MSIDTFRIGLIINPYAGIGGPLALKGSDSRALIDTAMTEGATSQVAERVAITLSLLQPYKTQLNWVAAPGIMGADILQQNGFLPVVVGDLKTTLTTALDTETLAAQLWDAGIDLLLFAGGDGTARNIVNAIGPNRLALGIPAGVKMHSGVYAVSPQAAARVVEEFLQGKPVSVAQQEVRDIDEEALRAGQINAKYYGELLAPNDNRYVQQVKNSGELDETGMQAEIAVGIVDDMDNETLYIVGAGTTPQAIMDELQLPNTLLGIDVLLGRELIASDVDEQQLLDLLAQYPFHPKKLMITATGKQGHIIGRGNQQLSPKVLKQIGKENLQVLISPKKLEEFADRPLLIDSSNLQLDKDWSGWIPIVIGYRETVVYPLSCGL